MSSLVAVVLLGSLAAQAAGDLRLTGTELRADGAHRALFADAAGTVHPVALGSPLVGCRLQAVRRRHVLLDCAGELSRVDLMDSPAARVAGLAPTAAMAEFPVPGEALRQAFADRQALARDLSVEPAVREGRLVGYRIAEVRPDGRLAGLGLHPGDVLLSVNGAAVAEPSGFMEMLRRLPSATLLECVLERAGETRLHRYLLTDQTP